MQEIGFEELVAGLQCALKNELPGFGAQSLMAPAHRRPAAEYLSKATAVKTAAVLLVMFPDEGRTRIALIERSHDGHTHAGQIGFPGGRQEPNETLAQTALREAEEECGIQKADVKLIGPLTPLYIPPSNFHVHPFVGAISTKPDWKLQHTEVSRVLTPDISHFLDKRNRQMDAFASTRGEVVQAPFYRLDDVKIWGATAMMLAEFAHILVRLK